MAALGDAARAVGGAPPLVVTVCGGEPTAGELTAFARWQHERWGTAGGDTLAARRAEEREAAAILGCATRWLTYPDAIYRGERYLSDEALFGPLDPDEAPLVEEVAAAILALPELTPAVTLYVPLAAGNHVDHQIVYGAGQRVAGRGRRVLAYEDCPYALLDDALPRRLAAAGAELDAPLLTPIGATLGRRLAAIACYRSQLPVIFRFTDRGPAVLADYARRLGGAAGPVERFWPLTAHRRLTVGAG